MHKYVDKLNIIIFFSYVNIIHILFNKILYIFYLIKIYTYFI